MRCLNVSKVSVIVPVYNASTYLEQCLDSLVRQTLSDIEVIIINDGSTDTSRDIVMRYIKQYPHIYYVERDNKGISYTRNQGMKLARGKYIMFLDSDDYLHEQACEKMYQAIEATSSDVVVCDYEKFSSSTKKEWKIPTFNPTILKEEPRLLFDVNSSPWNKIYRRHFLMENEILFPEGLKYEDAYFVLKVLCLASKISKLDESLLYYRVHPGSETTSMNAKVFDIFKILEMIEQEVKAINPNEQLYQYLEFFVINRLTVYNLQQAYQKDENIADQFIHDSFTYLNTHYPQWKRNPIFKQHNGLLKRLIKTNLTLTKIINTLQRKRLT